MTQRTCTVDGCKNPYHGRGFCGMHLQRWKSTGDPLKLKREPQVSVEELFSRHTEWQGKCFVWTGMKDPYGYGRLAIYDKINTAAHRYAWERVNGAIPPGIRIDHKDCYNPACVLVEHLRLATVAENGSNRSGPARNSSSGHRNVYSSGSKWKVVVGKGSTRHYRGTFSTIEDAAIAAESARQEIFGEFAGKG